MKPSIGDIIEATSDYDVVVTGEKYEVISFARGSDTLVYVRTERNGIYTGSESTTPIEKPFSLLGYGQYILIIHDGKEVVYD